jgi:hypothetical protein
MKHSKRFYSKRKYGSENDGLIKKISREDLWGIYIEKGFHKFITFEVYCESWITKSNN